MDAVQPVDPILGACWRYAVRHPRPDDAAFRFALRSHRDPVGHGRLHIGPADHLVAAFRATLEEVTEADIVIHVRDANHPDSEPQRRDVLSVLVDLGLGEPVEGGLIEVMNKIDLVDPAARASLENHMLRNSQSVALSAITGQGCDALLALVDRRLESEICAVRLDIPLTDGKTLASIYRHGEVLGWRDDNEAVHLSVRLSEADIARLCHQQRPH